MVVGGVGTGMVVVEHKEGKHENVVETLLI
jgi:hypothetical protein